MKSPLQFFYDSLVQNRLDFRQNFLGDAVTSCFSTSQVLLKFWRSLEWVVGPLLKLHSNYSCPVDIHGFSTWMNSSSSEVYWAGLPNGDVWCSNLGTSNAQFAATLEVKEIEQGISVNCVSWHRRISFSGLWFLSTSFIMFYHSIVSECLNYFYLRHSPLTQPSSVKRYEHKRVLLVEAGFGRTRCGTIAQGA